MFSTLKKKILIVDDELDMRIFISTLLEARGYETVITKDGNEGIRKAKDIKPDLIILDVMMPGEGGVQMYQNLKADEKLRSIPVMMLSAVAQKTVSHYLKMLTARSPDPIPAPEAYIEKPPDAEEILRVTENLIGR